MVQETSKTGSSSTSSSNMTLFPYRLQDMLIKVSQDKRDDVVSWLPDGKAFKVHKVQEFVSDILPVYFNQSKYKSFQRQLNLWGFERIAKSGTAENGGYWHSNFLRDQPQLCKTLTRQKTTRGGAGVGGSSSSASSAAAIKKTKTNAKTTVQVVTGNGLSPFFPPSTSVATVIPCDGSVSSTTSSSSSTSTAIEFEGCSFFPLEPEHYQEMTDRVHKIMDGTIVIKKHLQKRPIPATIVEKEIQELMIPAPQISTRKSLVVLH